MGKRTKKSFDAVAWMRQRRAEIDREDQGLTWEEKSGVLERPFLAPRRKGRQEH